MNGGSYRGHPVRPSLTAALEAALFHPAGLAMTWEQAEGPPEQTWSNQALSGWWAEGRPEAEGVRMVLTESMVASPHLLLLTPSRGSDKTGRLGAGDL